jgi:hypothetical protein
MWKILLLMLGLASSAAHAERLDTLKTFTGIWAPAEGGAAPPSVACEKELSSGGDRTHMNCSGSASAGSITCINRSLRRYEYHASQDERRVRRTMHDEG